MHTDGYKTVCYSSGGGGDGGRSLADVRRVIVPLLIASYRECTHITPELGDTYSRFIRIKLGKEKKRPLKVHTLYTHINKIRKSEKEENQKKNKNLGRNLGRTDHFIFFSPPSVLPYLPSFLPPSLPPEPPATTTTTTIKEELREFLVSDY